MGIRGETDVWVDYPVTSNDNAVAALLLNEEVGKLVATGGGHRNRYTIGLQRANEVLRKYPGHQACDVIRKILEYPYKKDKTKNKK